MAQLYYGYPVLVRLVDPAPGTRVTIVYRSLPYVVNWAATQTSGNTDLDTHQGAPSTVTRNVGSSGTLFLSAAWVAAHPAFLPSDGVAFYQEAHRLKHGTVQAPGGQYGTVYLDVERQYIPINWGDARQAWKTSPSTIHLDVNGNGVAGSAGYVAIPDSWLTANQVATGGGNKWPDGLGGVSALSDYEPAQGQVVSVSGPDLELRLQPQVTSSGTLYWHSARPLSLPFGATFKVKGQELPIVLEDPRYTTVERTVFGATGTIYLLSAWVKAQKTAKDPGFIS